jgi:hypothetical protein
MPGRRLSSPRLSLPTHARIGGCTALALAVLVALAGAVGGADAQSASPLLSHLHATASDPIYATYAAAYERSRFLLDEGYHLRFAEPGQGIEYTNARAGGWGPVFRVGGRTVRRVADMAAPPVITTSYGDVVRYGYRPFADVQVEVTFVVHSSRLAVEELVVTNGGTAPLDLEIEQRLRAPAAGFEGLVRGADGTLTFAHREPPDSWTVAHAVPHVAAVSDVVAFSLPPDRVLTVADSAALEAEAVPAGPRYDRAAGILVTKDFTLPPGGTARWRLVRGVAPADTGAASVLPEVKALLRASLDGYVHADERLYRRLPPPATTDARRQLLYWSAFTLLHQSMLPPEGRAREPYYVFAREPQWGWGHGGQVFHESLSMLAYALMDPDGAMRSQRLFAERQHADGYIPYRIGPYLEETIPYQGALTTSAPWYAWENLELYRLTGDRAFLRDMYASSARFWRWLAAHRDADGDGLFEWGGDGVLESVRDGDVAVWDQVGPPAAFEALDLNVLMAQEADALAQMASALGRPADAADWRAHADTLGARIERTFWDDSTGFYYHVDLRGRGFTHARPRDLVRREIIGFLPLWAGSASPAHADRLIRTLTDTARFWRPAGVPSLAADDPYYDPHGYWNGPVWVEWDYLVERGLLRYGRADLARELVDRVAQGMVAQLERTHTFWEMYGPDGNWAGHHQPYIWAGLIARMMLDAQPATPHVGDPVMPPHSGGRGSFHAEPQSSGDLLPADPPATSIAGMGWMLNAYRVRRPPAPVGIGEEIASAPLRLRVKRASDARSLSIRRSLCP